MPLAAQENANSLFTASFGAGFTTPIYRTGPQLDTGWNVQGQAGINMFGAHLGLVGEFDFNDLGINSSQVAIRRISGRQYLHLFASARIPVIRFNPNGKLSFYLIGGPGVYHRHVDFTEPSVATFTGFDPFFGVFYPVAVPTNQVVLSYSTTKLGVNGGAGFTYRIGSGHVKFFAEARYNQMYTQHPDAFIPVTFGFRW